MTKLYTKHELGFALMWIGIYVLGSSLADEVSRSLGTEKIVTLPFYFALCLWLIYWLHRHGLFEKYGLCRVKKSAKELLWYLPLLLTVSCNAWFGLRLNMGVAESAIWCMTMLLVGFLEELIFRGFLFKAMCRDSIKHAIIVSSVTFGLGHIVNLFNGSGMELLPNLLQVCYAVAVGFMFVCLFIRGGSLIPCIAAHSVVNMLSVFAAEPGNAGRIFSAAMLCLISAGYAVYLMKKDMD